MRILVLSDSHCDACAVLKALSEQRLAGVVIHLGDGEDDLHYAKKQLENKRVIAVKGNCDFGSSLSVYQTEIIEGKRFYITHGHLENVKSSLSALEAQAEKFCSDIVLYGHTHQSVTDYKNNVHYFNPGSLRNGEYGVVDITKSGIVCIQMKLRY